MPRQGAIIFSDLIGKLERLRVACDACGRDGTYRLAGLIDKRGGDAKLIDWLVRPHIGGGHLFASAGRKAMRPIWIFAMLISLLAGCGPDNTSNNAKQGENKQATSPEAKKFADQMRLQMTADRDNESYIKQLRASLKLMDGFIVVENPSLVFSMVLLPLNSSWAVSCGLGLSVDFGNAVTGDVDNNSNTVSNVASITLTFAPLKKERCRELAPLIGNEIQRIIKRQDS